MIINNLYYNYFLLISFLITLNLQLKFCINLDQSVQENESGRLLVYNPNGGVYKLILGWAIPVQVPMSVIWSHNFQFQYKPVDNATQLAFPILPKPKLSRATVYSLLAETMDIYGLDGSNCILKTICEVALSDISHDSIYGQIFNVIFTPHQSNKSKLYLEAWNNGNLGTNCKSKYKSCSLSLLDMISIYLPSK